MFERKLVTIRKVSKILSIEDADLIELALIDGWQCIVRKGEFKTGDLGLYFEIDSFLPIEERYEFLRKSSYKKLFDGSEGFRLKTIKLKGKLSQGLLLPLILFPEIKKFEVDKDYAEILKVVKYEPPLPVNLRGIAKGIFPSFIKKSDQERIQNLPEFFEIYKDMEFEETEKEDGCLHYNTLITTDIGQLKIGAIVNGKKNVKILTYNEKFKKNEFKKIINYWKYDNKKELYDIMVGHRGKGNRAKHIYCTKNHKFYTDKGYIEAKDLTKDIKLYHNVEKLSYEQKQIIIGTLLGDGSIILNGENCKFLQFGQSIHQSEYFDYKIKLLGGIMKEGISRRGGFSGSSLIRRASSISNLCLTNLLEMCLQKNKKIVNKKWANMLSPIALAFWYMDDGSIKNRDENTQLPTATLATNSFSLQECKLLQNALNQKFNITSHIGFHKGNTLTLSTEGSEIFFSLIAPYVCPSMKYKLPKSYEKLPCIYENGTFKLFNSIISTKILGIKKGFPLCKNSYNRHIYDLETEDNHNYFACNILTHNSSATYYCLDGTFGYCSRNLELKEEGENIYFKIAQELNLKETLVQIQRNIAIQGEIVGEGINKNPLKIKGAEFHVFDIYDIDKRRLLLPEERMFLIEHMNNSKIKHIPILKPSIKIFQFCKTMQELLEYAKGKSFFNLNTEREGLVFKSVLFDDNGQIISFKVVNNEYLLNS